MKTSKLSDRLIKCSKSNDFEYASTIGIEILLETFVLP